MIRIFIRPRTDLDWDDPWTSVTVDGESEDAALTAIVTNIRDSFDIAASNEDGELLLGAYDD
jgi:hypothetical protein